MVEIQSCAVNANIVNQSSATLCARNTSCSLEFSSDSQAPLLECAGNGNALSEVSAQLQRERQKNAELMERISFLEAQLQDRATTNEQAHRYHAADTSLKEFKKQKIEPADKSEAANVDVPQCSEMLMEINIGSAQCTTLEMSDQQDRIVNWMSMDDAQFLNLEGVKDGDCEVDTDDSDDDDGLYNEDGTVPVDDKDSENDDSSQIPNTPKDHLHEGHGVEKVQVNGTHKKEIKKQRRKECSKTLGISQPQSEIHSCIHEIGHKGFGSMAPNNKPLKVPFCPKEVKKIIESEALSLKNAQSHTIRKIIVFASLGIRHGCEDMYDLSFSHFNILHKGEPYASPETPGEHVLYENPGVRRKVFYPNRQHPTLCPVQIIEEEKAMRPSDTSCPSCLFLCIKYGGRTRNLPQNEYVRQRMGRNKLKSFGPLMCQMAMLVHVRSGSFFFKALGITLLFMAGFPDEIVQRETKYRNLDLLQKYYRKDENAEGEELFHLYPIVYEAHTSPNPQQSHGKATKSSAKKQAGSTKGSLTNKSQNTTRALSMPSVPSSSAPSQFGLMGYTTLQTHPMASFQGIPSHSQTDTPPISSAQIAGSSLNMSYHTGQTPSPFPIIPAHPPNSFMPMMYWPHPNAFQTCPFPSSSGYRSFPYSSNYMTLPPQPFYGHPFMPNTIERNEKKDATLLVETNSDSDSSSSIELKEA